MRRSAGSLCLLMCGLGLLNTLGCGGQSTAPVRAREAAVEVVPTAAPVTAPTPVLVAQTIPRFLTSPMYGPAVAPALSPGGGWMATVAPELKVLSTADGRVWADFGRCVKSATFLSEHELLVIACPEKSADKPDQTAVASILRWDLRDLTVKPIAEGPYARAALTADRERVVLSGSHVVQAMRLSDGGAVSRIALDESQPGEILRVSVEGDRAVAKVGGKLVSLYADGRVNELADVRYEGDVERLSPDLKRRAQLERGKLFLRDAESGATLSETLIGTGAAEFFFDRKSEQLAVYVKNGDKSSVRVVTKSGRLGCTVSLERPVANRIHWSTSGSFALEALQEGEALVARLNVFDAATCNRSLRSEPYPLNWSVALSDSLSLLSAGDEKATFISSVDGRLTTMTAAPFRRFRGVSAQGHLLMSGPEQHVFDPRRAEIVSEPPEAASAITIGGATLSIAMPTGEVAGISDRIPVGKGGLFLRAENGSKTALVGSTAFVPPNEQSVGVLYRCFSDAGHQFVACSGLSKGPEVDQRVAVWDERGRKLFDQSGTYVTFSADGSRALIRSNATATDYLVETRSGRQLASRESIVWSHVGFDRSGAWVAWSELGLLDAASGKVVGLEGRFFGGWLFGQEHSVALVRSARFPDPQDGYSNDFGPLDVFDVRQSKVTMSFATDAAIVEQSGERVLTRDAENVYRVRDAKTLSELQSFHSNGEATLSNDALFVHYQVGETIVTRRLSDGQEITQVPPQTVGERGFSFTTSGLYDGSDTSPLVLYRVGGVVGGKLVSEVDAARLGHRPGLAADFFAGKDLKVAQ